MMFWPTSCARSNNQVLDTFRALARQCRDFRRNEGAPVEDFQFAGPETTPSRIAIRHEVLQQIRAKLSREDAHAVDLMLENRDWNEIGDALGLRADTVRTAGSPGDRTGSSRFSCR